MKYYTVYREDTEDIIAFGNAVQCAEILGLKNARNFMLMFQKQGLVYESTIK